MATSFTNKINFTSKPETSNEQFDFSGGYIADVHETKLEPNQSPNMANVLFNDTKSAKTTKGYTRYNGDAVGSSSDQSNTGSSTGSLPISARDDRVSQTFEASGAINTLQVDVYLGMETSGDQQLVRVELWSTSSSKPSALLTNLAKSQILLVSGTSETAYKFRFNSPIALSAATTYALVVKPYIQTNTVDVNQVNVYYTGAAYSNGATYTSSDGGMNWALSSSKDLKFSVYKDGDTACTGLIRFYGNNNLKQLISKFGTTLYVGDDSTGAMTAQTLGNGSSLSSSNFIDSTTTNNTLLVVDDLGKIQKYRGSTNANYSTGTISVTNDSATVTGSSTVWATDTNAEPGEYIQLPDTKWYKITAIASDTSLTIETKYQGSTASSQSYVISPWGEVRGDLNSSTAVSGLTVPTPTAICNHANRIWTLKENTLSFSALDTSIDGEHFNDWDTANNTGAIVIPSGQDDIGTALYSINGYLFVFQHNALWELSGTSPANFELRNISNEVGLISRRTLVEYDRYLIFLSSAGVYMFDGSQLVNVSNDRVSSDINSWSNVTSPAATVWQDKYILSYTKSGETANSEALYYDIKGDKWGKFVGVYANIWAQWNGALDTAQVYFGSSNQASIYQWGTGGNFDGYEITTIYDTPSYSSAMPLNDKIAKRYYLQQVAQGDYNMTVTQYADLGNSISENIALTSDAASYWDDAVWDTNNWAGGGSIITTRIDNFQSTAKYYKYRFEQTGYNQGIEILGMNSVTRVRKLR